MSWMGAILKDFRATARQGQLTQLYQVSTFCAELRFLVIEDHISHYLYLLDSELTGWATGSMPWDMEIGSSSMVDIGLSHDLLGMQFEGIEPHINLELEVEALPNVLKPAKAYELVLEHRVKRFNLVKVLLRLEYPKGCKAQMDILLYRMKSVQVV